MSLGGLVLLAAGCAAATAATPSFDRDIVPILSTRCAICHMTGTEPGNMALTPDDAYGSLVGVKSAITGLTRVVPRSPELSYLVMKIEGTQLSAGGAGVRMPFSAPPLPAETIQLIRDWIGAGAPKN